MAKSYLLPCPCGKDIAIDISQAGQTAVCASCGKSVDVPTMRKIRELPEVEVVADVTAMKSGSWTGLKGGLFAIGMGVTVIALVVGAVAALKRHQLATLAVRPPLGDARQWEALVDGYDVLKMHDEWMEKVEGEGLGYWEPHPYLLAREQMNTWTMFLVVCGGLAVFGIGTIAISVLIRSR